MKHKPAMLKPTSEKIDASDRDLQPSKKLDIAKDDNKLPALNLETIQSCIHYIRGYQVILDRDLAKLYQVETGQLNRQVKRNIERFPDDFMFQLTSEEFDNLKSQIGTSSWGGDRRALPHAFTEHGIAMLAGLLRSDVAIKTNVAIMRAFVAMRRFLSANAGLLQRVEKLEQHQISTDHNLEQVLRRMDELSPAITTEQIFATGCVWDAWNFVSQLIRSAKKRIVLIDNFVDERVLTLLTKRTSSVSATIYTRYTKQFKLDLDKHNAQYNHVEYIQLPHKSHDRFLIIDEDVYLLGASVKDMGSSLCAITKMELSATNVLVLLK